jgi:hypothetical protein
MARPEKPGLSYINVDVDIFDDPKLMFVYERFSEKGELITIKLLLFIYANGYYLEWDDEVAVLFANRKFKNVSFDLVKDVVTELLKRRFFSEFMFKRFGILTSRGIQKRWLKVIKDSKRKGEISKNYDLLTELIPKSEEETPDEKELTTPKASFTPHFQEETTHSKEEEKKRNNSKGNESDLPLKNDELLIPKMASIWKQFNTSYIGQTSKDYEPLLKIAKFLCEAEKIEFEIKDLECVEKIKASWTIISEFISNDKFFKTYNLLLVEKHIQAIIQKIYHGTGTGNNNRGNSTVTDKQLNEAFARNFNF